MKIEYTEEKNKSIMETLLTTALDVEEMMAVGYALAKQVPKDPKRERGSYCSICGEEVVRYGTYCDECGQRIR